MNALSYFLAGFSLFLFGLAIALGRAYPRWTGLLAALSGAALKYNGAVEVAYGETLELPVLAQDLRLVEA